MNYANCLDITLVIRKLRDVFKGIFLVGGRGELRGRIFHGGREFSHGGKPNFPTLSEKIRN